MAFKKPPTHASVPESPDRLLVTLPRRKVISLLDHQGPMLRAYASTAVDAADVALQLPTGSGKTLVGLLIAEWRRRKFKEKVVYLCPTRQLVHQVVEQANAKYGMTVEAFVGPKDSYTPAQKTFYQDAERVAVTTYSSLFNINPYFDDPDIIIVDDAHAADNYIASNWAVHISRFSERTESLFNAIAGVLKGVIADTNHRRVTSLPESIEDISWVDKIPTHKLLEISGELRSVIDANIKELKERFAWSMLRSRLGACHMYISATEILIRPMIPPTWSLKPFASAKQRIYMSATLGAGGDLERLTGRPHITRLPIPEGWDRQGIGRRFFIFPERSLDADETLQLRRDLMTKAGRSLVLTTTDAAAREIREDVTTHLKYETFTADDLEESKGDFVDSDEAVAVIANRYDGIDFPDDECRLLFVEGLPRAANLQERFLMNRMGASLLFNERLQTRVMQAIGRCTRGLADYSAVVITGEDLPNYLTDRKRQTFLHPELQGELKFGIDQSTEVTASTILENFVTFLENDRDWEAANQQILDARDAANQEDFPAMEQLAGVVQHEIAWQTAMWNEDYEQGYEAARDVLGKLGDSDLRGYRALWHYLAGSAALQASKNGVPKLAIAAQQQFKRAKEAAQGIPWLIELTHASLEEPTEEEGKKKALMVQVEQLEVYLDKLGTVHNRAFAQAETQIRNGLKAAKTFEQAHVLLGRHLGFDAGKREEDASPDPWWRVDSLLIVFEDHADAKGPESEIDATKARQAASHPDWIRANVAGTRDSEIIPVLVTPAKKCTIGAVPSLGRVSYWDLKEFREWAERALVAVRALRRTFSAPGDLVWRAEAEAALVEMRADAPGLFGWLKARKAKDFLKE